MWNVYLAMLADDEKAYNEFWMSAIIQEYVHNGILIEEKEMYCENNHIWQNLAFRIWNIENMRNLVSHICTYNNRESNHSKCIEIAG